MSLIRTDLAVSPSYSRSGKTAASVNAQAMGELKKQFEQNSRKAARQRGGPTLSSTHTTILSKVLDSDYNGMPPSCGSGKVSREKDMCSSPREPATWSLPNSPGEDNSAKLPTAIDWDLIAAGELEAARTAGGPTPDHIKLALEKQNKAIFDKKVVQKPSCAFLNTGRSGRDSALSEGSTQAPESGRYNPKFSAVAPRSPAILITDRSLMTKNSPFAAKAVDDRPSMRGPIANVPKAYQAAPNIHKTIGRNSPLVSRHVCNVGAAEQKAVYGLKTATDTDIIYQTETYWQTGPGARKAHIVPDFAQSLSREPENSSTRRSRSSQPTIYSYNSSAHCSWTEKAAGRTTLADKGDPVQMARHLTRAQRDKRYTDAKNENLRLDYRQSPDKISSAGEFQELALQKPTMDFKKSLARDKDQAYIRQSKIDKGGADNFYEVDAGHNPAFHVVAFSKIAPRRPSTDMSSFGKDSPDVVYYPEKAWEKFCTRTSSPGLSFHRTASRPEGQDCPQSMLLQYPKARLLDKHQPKVNIAKSVGHKPLNDIKVNQESLFEASKIVSDTGRAKTKLGYAWHPFDCETHGRSLHVPAPDLAAGGKGRPSPSKKLLDMQYELSYKQVDKHVPVPNLMRGRSGQGMGVAEQNAETQRIEAEIKSMVKTTSAGTSVR